MFVRVVHSCASITISGTKTLDTLAPLISYPVSSFGGTFNAPVDGQPSKLNGGYNWPYSTSAGYGIGHYSVSGRQHEIARYNLNGILLSVVSTKLGVLYYNGKSMPLPAISNAPTTSTTSVPSINFNQVPTLLPAVDTLVTGSQSSIRNDLGSIITAIIGLIFLLSMALTSLCCREVVKDTFFGPAVPPSALVDLKAGRFELGALDYEDVKL